MGCNDLIVATDHKPLVKIFGDRTLDEINNTRLFRLKQRTLPWNFSTIYLPGSSNLAADAASRYPSPVNHEDYRQAECSELSTMNGHFDGDSEQATIATICRDAQEITALSWEAIAAAT